LKTGQLRPRAAAMSYPEARTFEASPRLFNEKTRRMEYDFFVGRDPKFVATIAKLLEKETFQKQDFLFSEGETGFSMYLISSGSVVVCKGKDATEVEIMSRGKSCGELALFGFSRRSSTAVAREHTVCFVLKNRVFQAVLERFPAEKAYFAQVAARKKKELRHIAEAPRPRRKGVRHLRTSTAWKGDSSGEDSDRDATDDPAPIMPDDEAAPLPDTEIPGSYPTMKRLSVLDLCAPHRHGPEQLAPLPKAPERLPVNKTFQRRMDRELAAIGRTAFARKMQVAEALSKDMAQTSSSVRPAALSAAPASLKASPPVEEALDKAVVEEDPPAKPPVKKALGRSDSSMGPGFNLNFDLDNMDLNSIDAWGGGRAVSA